MHKTDLICRYIMILTFSFVIQQPLFDVQPPWIFGKLKVRGGFDGEEIQKSKASRIPQNTRTNTLWVVRVWFEWAEERNDLI